MCWDGMVLFTVVVTQPESKNKHGGGVHLVGVEIRSVHGQRYRLLQHYPFDNPLTRSVYLLCHFSELLIRLAGQYRIIDVVSGLGRKKKNTYFISVPEMGGVDRRRYSQIAPTRPPHPLHPTSSWGAPQDPCPGLGVPPRNPQVPYSALTLSPTHTWDH